MLVMEQGTDVYIAIKFWIQDFLEGFFSTAWRSFLPVPHYCRKMTPLMSSLFKLLRIIWF